jgi:hypothetical protein
MRRYAIDNTSYRLSNKLRPCDDHRKSNEEDCGERAMNPEYRIVNYYLLSLEVVLQPRK